MMSDAEHLFMCTVEHHPAMKRKPLEAVLVRQMNLEPLMQGEVTHKEKDKYCVLAHRY